MNSLEEKKKLLNNEEINKITVLSNTFNVSFDEALLVMIQFNGNYENSYYKLQNSSYLFCNNENDRLHQNLVSYGLIPPQIGLDCKPLQYSNETMKNMLYNQQCEEQAVINNFFNSITPISFDGYGNRLN